MSTVAVVVAHGMGQQIQFETLDSLARGLLARPDGGAAPAVVRRVSLGGRPVGRVELTVGDAGGRETHVHLYEIYWAPLTEGQIGLAGVMAFLWRAGVNGALMALRPFERWMFGAMRRFPPPIRTLIYVLVALAVVAALVVMNTAIVAVGAARTLTGPAAAWLSNALLADLTWLFDVFLGATIVFGAMLGLSKATRRTRAALPFGALAVASFVGLVALALLTAVAIAFAWLAPAPTGPGAPALAARLPAAIVAPAGVAAGLTTRLLRTLVALACVAAAAIPLYVVERAAQEWRRQRRGLSFAVAVLFVALVWLLVAEIAYFRVEFAGVPARTPLLWLLLVVVSAWVRFLLVQFVGDVAIYVQPQARDRFNRVREAIKEHARDLVRAVYAEQSESQRFAYEAVVVVGHSLGSVVAYDALNRLLWEDAVAAADARLDVARRTAMFLTFGSPLDKIAFFFTAQRKRGSTAIRERLAAAVQPLIDDPAARRFPWVNIYSRWDIMSGRLDFYDLPAGSPPLAYEHVRDRIDPDARTWLWAHVEYWDNRLLFDTLHAGITGAGAGR